MKGTDASREPWRPLRTGHTEASVGAAAIEHRQKLRREKRDLIVIV